MPLPPVQPVAVGVSFSKPLPVDLSYRPPTQVTLGVNLEGITQPHVDQVCPMTAIAGVRSRMAREMPNPEPQFLRMLLINTYKFCTENLVPLPPDTDTSQEEFLRKAPYTQKRKEQLKLTFEEIWTLYNDMPKNLAAKCFVKDETYIAYKHARGIYSRSDMFKMFSGPIFKCIEEEVYKLPMFVKHIPVADRPRAAMEYLYVPGGKYFMSDFTSMEATFQADVMYAVEFVLYAWMLQFLPEFEEFMSMISFALAGLNVCQFKYFTLYLTAKRLSGEMNTSLGNGFANAMFMDTMFKWKNTLEGSWGQLCSNLVPGDLQSEKRFYKEIYRALISFKHGLRFMVEGDDCIGVFTGIPPNSDDFKSIGAIIKIDIVDYINEGSFCGIIFHPDDEETLTDPLDVMATIGWTTRRYVNASKLTKMKLLRCKALSYAHQYPGCPIVAALSHYILRCTRNVTLGRFAHTSCRNLWEQEQLDAAIRDEKKIVRKPVGIGSRLVVEEMFGVSIELQLKYERYFDKCDKICQIPDFGLDAPVSWTHYHDTYVIRRPADVDHPPLYPGLIAGFTPEFGWEGNRSGRIVKGVFVPDSDRPKRGKINKKEARNWSNKFRFLSEVIRGD